MRWWTFFHLSSKSWSFSSLTRSPSTIWLHNRRWRCSWWLGQCSRSCSPEHHVTLTSHSWSQWLSSCHSLDLTAFSTSTEVAVQSAMELFTPSPVCSSDCTPSSRATSCQTGTRDPSSTWSTRPSNHSWPSWHWVELSWALYSSRQYRTRERGEGEEMAGLNLIVLLVSLLCVL